MKIILNPSYSQSEQIRFTYFKNEILRFVSKDKKYNLLDIGCSQLDFDNINTNIQSFGIDINDSKVYDEAHFKKCNLDKESLPFRAGYFDIVVAGEVLEHLKRPFEFVEEISRVLRSGGILLLSTPNPQYYLEILKECIGNKTLDDKDHLNLFSRIHLTSYAEKYNLKLEKVARYKFWIPFIKLMILSNWTPPLLNYQNIYLFRKL
jgi:2-polyprenyl-3-methyl-5-hydroxy-6-metoxy-1,4-benzoquinol methylase